MCLSLHNLYFWQNIYSIQFTNFRFAKWCMIWMIHGFSMGFTNRKASSLLASSWSSHFSRARNGKNTISKAFEKSLSYKWRWLRFYSSFSTCAHFKSCFSQLFKDQKKQWMMQGFCLFQAEKTVYFESATERNWSGTTSEAPIRSKLHAVAMHIHSCIIKFHNHSDL